MSIRTCIVLFVFTSPGTATANAQVTEYHDRDAWFADVGETTTIDFSDFSNATVITDQYAGQGILVTSYAVVHESTAYINDGHGLFGPEPDGIQIEFAKPIQWVAADHPGVTAYRLFLNGELVYEQSTVYGGGGVGFFGGLVSETPFDAIEIFRPKIFGPNAAYIDDLHFGPPIPVPGVLGVFALAAVAGRGRRRRE